MLRAIAWNSVSSRAPVTTMPSVPSGVAKPSRSTASRNLPAKRLRREVRRSDAQSPGRDRSRLDRSGRRGPKGLRRARTPQVRRRAQQRPQNLGKQVGVFVSVDVRNRDSGRLNLANLRGGFGNNFFGVDAAGDRARRESHHAIAKVCALVRVGSCWASRTGWPSISTTWQPMLRVRDRLCQLSRLCESRTVGHQRRRSHDAARVSLNDAPGSRPK